MIFFIFVDTFCRVKYQKSKLLQKNKNYFAYFLCHFKTFARHSFFDFRIICCAIQLRFSSSIAQMVKFFGLMKVFFVRFARPANQFKEKPSTGFILLGSVTITCFEETFLVPVRSNSIVCISLF